ncbi:MAG: hypothetical protein AVDCRST_MAG25-3116 [uncultured Rubrobacteraceae bacterium]|uniref:Uncharacterized protein n=1 Tax=uncultured Rubrobacteraceae bacterium TaxID=349277 RepID=A0A6J4S777_9ACTN|nr:MAG: hypothetical protein AVDCRST_MAG25-3116 [uncultured Rubrobacteraceae bacterium]
MAEPQTGKVALALSFDLLRKLLLGELCSLASATFELTKTIVVGVEAFDQGLPVLPPRAAFLVLRCVDHSSPPSSDGPLLVEHMRRSARP